MRQTDGHYALITEQTTEGLLNTCDFLFIKRTKKGVNLIHFLNKLAERQDKLFKAVSVTFTLENIFVAALSLTVTKWKHDHQLMNR